MTEDGRRTAEDFAFLGKVTRLRWVKSLGAMARYLTHDGTPDKAQYSADGVLEFGAASWRDWCAQVEDINAQMQEMRAFIREYDITEPADFQDWCDVNNPVWSRLLDMKCQNAIYRYIDRHRARIVAEISGKSLRGISATPPQGGTEPRTPNPVGTGKEGIDGNSDSQN